MNTLRARYINPLFHPGPGQVDPWKNENSALSWILEGPGDAVGVVMDIVDGDATTMYLTVSMVEPWIAMDLKAQHRVWAVKVLDHWVDKSDIEIWVPTFSIVKLR